LVCEDLWETSPERGEILLDVDSTDDPTYGQQQLSFFNGGYDQHMYHPLLIFERHTGCLLAARLRAGTVASHARIIPLLLRIVPRLQREFPKVRIRLRADACFATPMLYEFCEFFGIQYAIGIGTNSRLQGPAQRLQRRLAKLYRRTGEPQRSFSSFRYRAHTWSHQRRICYKAEHTAAGTNLRFPVTNLSGRSRSVFSFYNDRGECENRIEELKNGYRGLSFGTGTRASLFGNLRQLIIQRKIAILDDPGLLHQLRSLEEVRAANGNIDIRPARSAKDDLAIAVALAASELSEAVPDQCVPVILGNAETVITVGYDAYSYPVAQGCEKFLVCFNNGNTCECYGC
jgi:Transposase DDE domain group 1